MQIMDFFPQKNLYAIVEVHVFSPQVIEEGLSSKDIFLWL